MNVRKLAAGALAAGAILAASAAPAQAANACCWQVDWGRTGGTGVAYRNAPAISAKTGAYGLPAGATVGLWCWSYGDRVGPNGNSLWWHIDAFDGRGDFWVADHYLTTPAPNGRPTLTGNCPGADETPN
ncbi:hypothetical protein [Humibacillus xanthopallidus]|uniref:SH3 domain-containing protein n=1 Tax=Humibacillus xanthopallidus TaxID=412689 RepID=A0A543I389_9MICO|nr:hypothetical protein [Humibacillus xanthopallidus]TQM65056.1 hypothetical protein FBY41_1438 [Humibacillus xanthopallidus]